MWHFLQLNNFRQFLPVAVPQRPLATDYVDHLFVNRQLFPLKPGAEDLVENGTSKNTAAENTSSRGRFPIIKRAGRQRIPVRAIGPQDGRSLLHI